MRIIALFGCLAAIVGLLIPTQIFAQVSTQDTLVDEIVILGSRTKPRSAGETPAPVDFLAGEALRDTAYDEAGRALQSLAPSFNFPSTSIADGTDSLKPATLRGLGPDQTLVLVNGIRRHKSALVHVNSSVGRGTAGTDMNAIPTSFLDNIEILRDGASALYGSDAIGGVINLQLRRESSGEAIFSTGETTEGDGRTQRIALNGGLSFANDGFIFVGLDWQDKEHTNRSGLAGTRLYTPENTPEDEEAAKRYEEEECNAKTSEDCKAGEFTANRRYMIVGDPDTNSLAGIIHAGGRIFGSWGAADIAAFILTADRDNQSTGFYREPDDPERNVAEIYPDGFLPRINSSINDESIGLTADFVWRGWDAKLSYGQGKNTFDFFITNSLNASFGKISPREADSGGFSYEEKLIDFDLRRSQDLYDIAVGVQARRETYAIRAGELLSYINCSEDAARAIQPDAALCLSDKTPGIQVFPGFSPENALERDRDALSVFAEISRAQSYDWGDTLLTAAVRHEDYDGFDNVTTAKLGGFWQVNDNHAVRGTASTGFRAPSMHQLYFSNVSTQFGAAEELTQTLTARNDSELAKALGIPILKEETAQNIGLGYVFTNARGFSLTLDAYQIDIDDRIILSTSVHNDADSDKNVLASSPNAIAIYEKNDVGAAQFFLNGPDTRTRGIELVAEWQKDMSRGTLVSKLVLNATDTEVTSSFAPPSLLDNLQPIHLFGLVERDIIESWQPKNRATLSFDRQVGRFAWSLALNHYGEYLASEVVDEKYKRQVISSADIVDMRVHWDIDDSLRLTLRGDNVFDTYPDEDIISNTRAGTIKDIVNSPHGVFRYSRRTAPYGFNGAYWGVSLKKRF